MKHWQKVLVISVVAAFVIVAAMSLIMASSTDPNPTGQTRIKSNMELWEEANPNWVNVNPSHPNSKLYRELCRDDKANGRIARSDTRC